MERRQWTIKGISNEAVELARSVAKARGMKLAEFMSRAVDFYANNTKPTTIQILDHIISISRKNPEERTPEELALTGALKEMIHKL